MAAERKTSNGITLASIPIDYEAPANATPEEITKARYAEIRRAGINLERAKQKDIRAAELGAQATAHKQELDRTGKIVSRAAHRDGVLQGIIAGMIVAIALMFGTWLTMRQVVFTNVATERIPRASVPILQNEHTQDAPYTRQGCEPGACGR